MIEMGEEAKMYHATLRIHGIPVFYFPFVEHPTDNLGRKSGFLIPVIGTSNTRGTILGDGFYWAINRSSDASSARRLYSRRGWAQHGVYRAVGYKYQFHADYFGVVDEKGYPPTGQNQGGEELKANGFLELPDELPRRALRGLSSAPTYSAWLSARATPRPSIPKSARTDLSTATGTAIPWDILSLATRTIRARVPVT